MSVIFLFSAAGTVGTVTALGAFRGLAILIGAQRAFGYVAESRQPLIYHIPQAHRQMVAVSAVDSHALEAVAVMAARLLARAVVTGFAHLTQKFQLNLERFFLLALAVEVVLQDGQFVSVYFHKYRSSIYCTTSHFYHSRVLTVSSKQLYPKPCFRAVIQIFSVYFIYFAIDKKNRIKPSFTDT